MADIAGRRASVPATSRRKRWRWSPAYLFVMPFFVIFIVFQLYPLIYSTFLSFTSWDGLSNPVPNGVANYARLLSDPIFYSTIFNTLVIWVVSIVPQLVLALLLALVLNERRLRGKGIFRAIFYFPNLVTPATIGVLFSLMFDWQHGLVNEILTTLHISDQPINWLGVPSLARLLVSIIILWQWFGYNMLLYSAGLQAIPHELTEAARLDGASAFKTVWYVVLPRLRPIVIFTVITSIIGGAQIFDVPFTLVGTGPKGATQTMVMYLYEAAFQRSQYGYGAAIAIAVFVIIAALSLLSLKLVKLNNDD